MLNRLLTVGLFVVFAGIALAETELKIPECSSPPKLDGTLNDNCWPKTPQITKMLKLKGKSGKKFDNTSVYLCRDKKWLYLGIRCRNKNMKHVSQTVFKHDGPVCKDDSIEFFIDPAGNAKSYYHFMLNFANVRHERKITVNHGKINRLPGWNTPWRTVTKRFSGGWNAEIAIPLYDLKSQDLGKAQINVVRNFIEVEIDRMGSKMGENRLAYTLSKLTRNAHEPEHFTPVKGLGGFKVELPFAPRIDSAEAGNYQTGKNGSFFPVKIAMSCASAVAGKVKVNVIDQISGKPAQTISRTIKLDGSKKLNVNVPVKSFDSRKVSVKLVSPDSGLLLAETPVTDTSPLQVMRKIIPNRNYYTTEKNAFLKLVFGFSPEQLKSGEIKILLDGKTIAGNKSLSPETLVSIPVDVLKLGKNSLEAVFSRNGKKFAAQTVKVTRLKPNPGKEIKIDNFKRIMLVNGKPFFMFALFHALTRGDSMYAEGRFKFLKDIGFNTVYRVGVFGDKAPAYRSDLDDAATWMKLAQKYGFYVINRPKVQPKPIPGKPLAERLKIHRERYEKDLPFIIRETNIVKQFPNLLAYYNVDEPNLVNPEARIAVAEWYYKTVQPLDPYRPQMLLYAKYIPAGNYWTDWCELLGYDVYIRPDTGVFYSEPGYAMAYYTCMLEERARQAGKVNYMLPCTGMLDPRRFPIPLTGQQQLCQSYTAIIYGAKGLMYFPAYMAIVPEQWQALKTLAAQTKALAPAILNDAVPQKISYTPGKVEPKSRIFPMVNAAIFKYPDGDYVMMAANFMHCAVKTAITVKGLWQAGRMFGKPADFAVKNETFSDKLEPFGVRAYRLKLKNPGAKIMASLKMAPVPEEKAYQVPFLKIVNKIRNGKNYMPNPVFEAQKIKGLPDYFRPYLCQATDTTCKGSAWYLDRENPWHGKPSMRMTYRIPDNGKSGRELREVAGTWAICCPPVSNKKEKYVFSFYAKAKKAGETVSVNMWECDRTSKAFRLATNWKRYSMQLTVPPGPSYNNGIRTITIAPGRNATVWINGLQLEKGDTPTEFTDDSKLEKLVIPEDKGNLVKNGHAEYGEPAPWERLKTKNMSYDAHSGKFSFKTSDPRFSPYSNLFPVDTAKTYELSGWFKATAKSMKILFGLIPYDEKKHQIRSWNINPVKGTETELTAPCQPGDNFIKVKNASNWKSKGYYCAAFKYQDGLPNFNVTARIKSISRLGNDWVVNFIKPCGMKYPNGTKLMQHRAGTGAIFAAACMSPVPEKWTKFSGTVKGVSRKISMNEWWPGTKYAKVIILKRPASRKAGLLFDDISAKIVEK